MLLDFISDQRQVTDPWEEQLRETAQVRWLDTDTTTAEPKRAILTYVVGLCLSLRGFLWRESEAGRDPSEPNISENILVICHDPRSPGGTYKGFSFWAAQKINQHIKQTWQ